MEPAKEVGGDFYDFFLIDEDYLAIVIGDVSGKGIPAALYMIIAKSIIKENFKFFKEPDKLFNYLNNDLLEFNSEDMFITSWMGIINLKTGKLSFVNAGHDPPLARLNNEYKWLKTDPNFVVGVIENIDYDIHEIQLNNEDKILLYTDGVTEANNDYNGFFSKENLMKSFSAHEDLTVEEDIAYIKKEISKFTKGQEQFDDITILLVKFYKK